METDDRRWMRDLGALLALPSLWVDHAPAEIADGLLGVLVGMLGLDAAFARFGGAGGSGGATIEAWRPTGPEPPEALRGVLEDDAGTGDAAPTVDADSAPSGVRTAAVRSSRHDGGITRVASLTLALPWGRGLVVASAARSDFPTERETHLLRVAVGQAAIALHTARRLAAEQRGRREAEQELERQSSALRSLLEEVTPVLTAVSRRVREAADSVQDVEGERSGRIRPVTAAGRTAPLPVSAARPPAGAEVSEVAASDTAGLTRRELEVLGLLAQGLSNKEIAGVMWLSDRTVERHITSLYRKIGVARRSEATAFALRHGIA